jgi:DNA polymerase I
VKDHQFDVKFLDQTYRCFYVKNLVGALSAIDQLSEKDCLFGIDTETEALPKYSTVPGAALSPLLSTIRLLQVCDGKNSIVFDIKFIEDFSIFKKFLETKRFIAHNAIFDLQFFMRQGIQNMNIGCTYLLAKLIFHALYPDDGNLSAGLGNLVNEVFKVQLYKKMQQSDWSVPELTFEQVEYAALDAITVLKLAEKFAPALVKLKLERSYKLAKDVQHPVALMQLEGLALDEPRYMETVEKWRKDLRKARKDVVKLTGLDELTPHKLAEYLESTLEPELLAIWPRTETGKLSTDSNTFADFSHLELIEPFSRFQKAEKLCTAFGMKLLTQRNQADGKLHAQYKIMGARTGRFSCTKPNLQQLPRDKDVRKNFVPDEGKVFICADYSQIELRVAAEVSQDETMLRAYKDGVDLHALTASKISKKPLEAVTKADRQMAKAFNFGLLFGLGTKKFSHYAKKSYGVDVSQEDASAAIKIFRDTYAGYREWQLNQAAVCGETKEVRTPCGKLRKLPADNTYGTSMNTPVQGGAAEVMCHALVRLYKFWLKNPVFTLVNCVHDEIMLATIPEKAKYVQGILEGCMVEGFLDVFPNACARKIVEAKVGPSWGDVK